MTTAITAQKLQELARRAGFLAAAIAPAGPVPQAQRLHTWLERGYCAEMHYLRRDLAKRLCPAESASGARSVICLAASYVPPADADRDGLVARYARGADYHEVLQRRCAALIEAVRAIEPSFVGRAFVDSGPVMERSLAAAAGLGWIGRNACMFVEGAGSYCVLAEIVCNLPLPPGNPIPPRCGDCRACVAACPTGALKEDGLVDARCCISYLTIEHRGPIDPQFWPQMGARLFGCDVCQSVCPCNRNLPAGDGELLGPSPVGARASRRSWDGPRLTGSRPRRVPPRGARRGKASFATPSLQPGTAARQCSSAPCGRWRARVTTSGTDSLGPGAAGRRKQAL